MRKGRISKEGLMQYMNIAHNTNVASIEVVIQKFLALADAAIQEAQERGSSTTRLKPPLDLSALPLRLSFSPSAGDTPYAGYRSLLSRVLFSCLLSLLSQIYSVIKVSAFLELAKLLGDFGPEQVKAYLTGCARRGKLRIRADHVTETTSFIDESFAHSGEPNVAELSSSPGSRPTPPSSHRLPNWHALT